MAPPTVEVIHANSKGTATIEYATSEPFWRFRSPKGTLLRNLRTLDITGLEVSTLRSGRIVLTICVKKQRQVFLSTKLADLNWDALLAELRRVTRGQFKKFRAPFSKMFPPIEYIREPAATGKAMTDTKPLKLFDLPQELLDIIFDLAYPTEDNFNLVTRSSWEIEQKRLSRTNGSNLQRLPFTPKVCEFMVSRRFLREACMAWVQNQNFCCSKRRRDLEFVLLMSHGVGVLGNLMPSLNINFDKTSLSIYSRMPYLIDVTMKITEDTFESLEPRFAWNESLGPRDFETVLSSGGFDKIRGLKRWKLVPGTLSSDKTEEQSNTWRANVAALESFLLPYVSRPRVSSAPTPADDSEDEGDSDDACSTIDLRTFIETNPPLGVSIMRGALILRPESLDQDSFTQTQEFLNDNREVILEAIQKKGGIDQLSSKMGELSLNEAEPRRLPTELSLSNMSVKLSEVKHRRGLLQAKIAARKASRSSPRRSLD